MSKIMRLTTIITCGVLAILAASIYALFHGYFDRGDFSVLSVQRSPSGQLAMIAKRSDHEALNGDEIFVLLGSHVFSPVELRHALHSSAVVFSSDRDCLSLTWKGNYNLEISCKGKPIAQDEINRQVEEQGNVTFTYVNIASDH